MFEFDFGKKITAKQNYDCVGDYHHLDGKFQKQTQRLD
jgi:hypothetical protein